jgi:hypothetical protein
MITARVTNTNRAVQRLMPMLMQQLPGMLRDASQKKIEKPMVALYKKRNAVFEENLIRSIQFDIKEITPNGIRATVGPTVPYAKDVESGRRPGKFSRKEFGKLMRWVSRKLKIRPPMNLIVANRIRTSITANGTKGKFVVRDIVAMQENKFRKDVERKIRSLVQGVSS